MALFLITAKQNHFSNGIHLEKGMTVEVSSIHSTTITANSKEIADAFMRKYGIDIKKNGGLSSVYLDIKKVD